MSALAVTAEAPQSEVVESSNPSTQGEHSPYRCRLFQGKHSLTGEETVTQVWDYPKYRAPKKPTIREDAELKFTLTGNSIEEVEEQVDQVLKELGYPVTGSWNHRGML